MEKGMNKRRVMLRATVIVMAAGGWAQSVSSAPALVDATSRYRHWTTVCANEVPLRWNWETNATHATLEIAGMNGTLTTNFYGVISNWVWRVSGTEGPSVEDVHTLTLTFLASGDRVVGALTSQLAVVKGSVGPAVVDAVAGTRAWSRVKASAVIPYDAAWSMSALDAVSATLAITKTDGVSRTNVFSDTAGYYGWKPGNSGWGYGTFNLVLTFSGMTNEWTATLMRPIDGTVVSVR